MKSFAPVLLDMHLEHGDMVVMHGAEIQKYYEVSLACTCCHCHAKQSFAITCSHITSMKLHQVDSCGLPSQPGTSSRTKSPLLSTGGATTTPPKSPDTMVKSLKGRLSPGVKTT